MQKFTSETELYTSIAFSGLQLVWLILSANGIQDTQIWSWQQCISKLLCILYVSRYVPKLFFLSFSIVFVQAIWLQNGEMRGNAFVCERTLCSRSSYGGVIFKYIACTYQHMYKARIFHAYSHIGAFMSTNILLSINGLVAQRTQTHRKKNSTLPKFYTPAQDKRRHCHVYRWYYITFIHISFPFRGNYNKINSHAHLRSGLILSQHVVFFL